MIIKQNSERFSLKKCKDLSQRLIVFFTTLEEVFAVHICITFV